MYSPESVSSGKQADRWIADLVATYQVTDDLALMLNDDYGHDENALTPGNGAGWQGLALYAKYDVNDRWPLAGRYECFRNDDGTKLPTISATGVGDLSLQELTLTSEHKLNTHLKWYLIPESRLTC